ncbi:hypothetical protein [Janibacter corallicola]|uniref:hypothetical protein n=1 Tax=Janibacter corallicola TaxID=415212 RepID=UPI0012ED2F1C|nr:hypothetical protein [Janibacter corallicola]
MESFDDELDDWVSDGVDVVDVDLLEVGDEDVDSAEGVDSVGDDSAETVLELPPASES